MNDFTTPPGDLHEMYLGPDTSHKIIPIDQILPENPHVAAEGVKLGTVEIQPLDLSNANNQKLIELYNAYCDFFEKNIGTHSFQRHRWEGYDLRVVLRFWQFASASNYASDEQKDAVNQEARSFFGAESEAYNEYSILISAINQAQIGIPSKLERMSIEDLLDYYAELYQLDELMSEAEQAHGLGEWIVEKGGSFFKAIGRLAAKILRFLGWLIGISDFISDNQRESVRLEINKRINLVDDDFITYEWAKSYVRNKYGEDIPI